MTRYVNSQELRRTWECTRQAINYIANREGWRVRDYNRPYWYNVEDVQKFILSREHSDRAKDEYGLKFRGLLRHENGFNEDCPVCKELLDNPIK